MTSPTDIFNSAPNAGLGRLYYLAFTIPTGTTQAAPYSEEWPLEDNYLISIESRIPPGPCGLMGFRILWSQQQIVPWANNSWLIANDERIPWQASTAISTSALTVEGYNTGSFPHTVYLRALISTLPPAVQQEAAQESGTVALPGSQVSPDYTAVQTFTSDETESEGNYGSEDEYGESGTSSTEPVVSSMSLVAGG